MCKIEVGIDTLSYYHVLTPQQKQEIVESIEDLPEFRSKGNYWEKTYVYRSSLFQKKGVKLVVSQYKGERWGLLIVVHPMLVLGNSDRSKLYMPHKKGEYNSIVKRVDKVLKKVNVPCSVDDMKLYRCDVTENWMFDKLKVVDEYIRIQKKSCLLPHYSWDTFREEDHKARDCKAANKHSCKQYCKSAAFFAYDKTAQLEMIEAFPEALIGKHIFRLEAQLRRKAMKKWVGKDCMDSSNWAIIKELGKSAEKILDWYLKRMHPVEGNHLRYKDAVKIVSQIKGKKKQERMLYLLKKTSDSDTLTAALKKLKKKYHLSENQCRTVLKQFKKLGISPITLTNNSDFKCLPGIHSF